MAFDINGYALTMARYNRWMNQNIYAAARQLSDQQLKADCGLFFQSIYATLNHLLVCDQMWLARFTGNPITVTSLTEELFAEPEKLKQARIEEDDRILVWAQSLSTPLPERLRYKSVSHNAERDVDFAQAIVHFFNHQTHHRGQISAALSQQGIDFGVTDLIFMPENT